MILVNNKVLAEGIVLTADWQTIKKQEVVKGRNAVQKKVAFRDDERAALTACGFDFAAFDNLKAAAGAAESAEAKQAAFDDIKAAAPCFLYLKQKHNPQPVVVAVAFDSQVFLNKNVDDALGVGAEATRYRFQGFINGFINHYTESLTDEERAAAVVFYNGEKFEKKTSAYDDRKSTAPAADEGCLDLD